MHVSLVCFTYGGVKRTKIIFSVGKAASLKLVYNISYPTIICRFCYFAPKAQNNKQVNECTIYLLFIFYCITELPLQSIPTISGKSFKYSLFTDSQPKS
jgi:hypothetical protein